ncbi:hypothetical protein TVAG_518040 [Trichomonas vaginalis G3]|uniref:Uncharacterized protein n=1 Tax=Trichomonas vaginalis (strain ATCC PRA-98 / G3) TaxID=412133 RepID=A2HA76_TRIV3|nr:hypothetical protein TVAGG3_0809370 [Trichomonas vaginalis G3]EAX73691.1 hypothetical protein TVAG_518040 [Trichomonas vaginalis G3]KAI5497092.1 hypothetical protein TVAGG3_0809370 [Trichomonas vaginalis G3]|eukprot:XP_001286621.1 hypothetical protein [Trichomonas vaginalis G3]
MLKCYSTLHCFTNFQFFLSTTALNSLGPRFHIIIRILVIRSPMKSHRRLSDTSVFSTCSAQFLLKEFRPSCKFFSSSVSLT